MNIFLGMRVVQFHEYGPPDVLRVDEMPDSRPGPGEVLVRVTAAGIGFADVQIRAGLMRTVLPDLPPEPPWSPPPGAGRNWPWPSNSAPTSWSTTARPT